MKVVLVYPYKHYFDDINKITPYPNIARRPYPMISLGMLYLVNAIRDICDVVYIDNNILKYPSKALLRKILAEEPDIVGFGGTFVESQEAIWLSKMLREKGVKTIYGGSNATANPEKHVKYFNYVLRGEGEEAFKDFLLTEFNVNTKGICTEGNIKEPAFNLGQPDWPARDIINIDDYRNQKYPTQFKTPIDVVMSSRGCPYACSFCSSKYIWNQNYSMRPVEDVLSEVEYMTKEYGTKTIHFREDNLTVNRKYLYELCAGLKEIGVDWICQSRVDTIDYYDIIIMKSSGCVMICCGFESANDSTLEYINKGFKFKDIANRITDFEMAKIYWGGGFMVGVLNEGLKEIQNTIDYVNKIKKLPYSLQASPSRFVGFPVSELYHEIIDNDLVAYNWNDGELLIPNTYKLKYNEVDQILKENNV